MPNGDGQWLLVGAALIKKYSSYRTNQKKVPRVFPPKLVRGDLKSLPDGWQMLFPSWPILSISFSSNIDQNQPPLALNACHSYVMLAILAPQWQGANTFPCHCEAGILSLGVPPVKITPNRVKYSKLHSRWCNFPLSDALCPPQGTTLSPDKTPPPSQDPSRHALCLRSLRRGVFRASASAHSHEKLYYFLHRRAQVNTEP